MIEVDLAFSGTLPYFPDYSTMSEKSNLTEDQKAELRTRESFYKEGMVGGEAAMDRSMKEIPPGEQLPPAAGSSEAHYAPAAKVETPYHSRSAVENMDLRIQHSTSDSDEHR